MPAPWDNILREHRKAFLALSDEISELAKTNRDLLGAGFRAARDTLRSSIRTANARRRLRSRWSNMA